MKYLVFVFSMLLLVVGCTKKPAAQEKKSIDSPKSTFTLPAIPSVITTDEQKCEFLAENYWTNFNFKDTTQIRKNPIAEQLYNDFLGLLTRVPIEVAQKGVEKMMKLAEVDSVMYTNFVSLGDKYLFDPNATTRNEELYIVVVQHQLASKWYDDAHKIRPRHRYELALKNRIGKKALDFKYTLASGKQSSLYKTNAEYVLLYFNNPGCADCKRVKQQLVSSSLLTNVIQEGKLKLLAIYPDEDLAEWHKDKASVPTSWINAYDKGTVIKDKDMYDLKAIPTLYLLDKNKTVLLKDARFEEVEQYLSNRQ